MYYWTQWTVRSTVTTSPKLHSHQKAGEHANCYDCGQCMRFRHDRYPFNIYIYRRRMYIERDSRRYKITFIVVYYCVLLSNGTMNNKRLIQTVQTHKHTIHTWHMCERQKRPCYGDHTLNTLNTLAYKTNKAIHTQTENIVSESFLFFFFVLLLFTKIVKCYVVDRMLCAVVPSPIVFVLHSIWNFRFRLPQPLRWMEILVW